MYEDSAEKKKYIHLFVGLIIDNICQTIGKMIVRSSHMRKYWHF